VVHLTTLPQLRNLFIIEMDARVNYSKLEKTEKKLVVACCKIMSRYLRDGKDIKCQSR